MAHRKLNSPFHLGDVFDQLPSGWIWTSIAEITQDIEKVDPANNPDELFIYLDISSIDNSRNIITQPKTYYGYEAPSRARQLVQASDVLFSTVRVYLKNIALVPDIYDGQIASTGFSVLRAENGISAKYLFYLCLKSDFISSLEGLQRGTSYPAIRDSDMRAQVVPLAPLNEQRRIVEAIEALFSRLDAGIAALQRAQKNLKRYKASVLKAACEGQLVPQDPDDEPASELLARILDERRAKWEADELARYEAQGRKPPKNWRDRYREPQPPDTSDLPELPEGWVWASVEELTPTDRPCAYGVLQPGPDLPDGVPLVRVSDINDGRISIDAMKRIDPLIAKEYRRTQLGGGEVLITLVGSIGRTAVVPEVLSGANTARAVGVMPIVDLVYPFWVELWFRNPSKMAEMTNKAHEVARKTLNLEDVRSASVALPPASEQKQVVDEVNRLWSVIEEIETSINHNLRRAERLRQSILKDAFVGRLVPQNPDDEPASVLLERIRAEREQH